MNDTMPYEKITYINKSKQRGVKYNWKKVFRFYRSLKCPVGFYDPTTAPVESAKYNIVFSARGGGKTINTQLLGMCLNAMYGAKIVYIRQGYDQIAQKSVANMFNVIKEFGYISEITKGRWNSCMLKSRRWYYCNVDVEGQIVEKAAEEFMFMCSIDEAQNLKSGWNEPMADFIMYDEFIPTDFRAYMVDEFPRFCDLLSTIVRQRFSPVIFMLANNTDKESPYFYDFEVDDQVKAMKKGDHFEYKTAKGTPCYVEWFDPDTTVTQKTIRSRMNELFFGFTNPKLGAITNDDWQITPRQRIPNYRERTADDRPTVEVVVNNIYVKSHSKFVKMDIVIDSELGLCCYVHWATKTYPDSIILTNEDRYDPRFQYGFGTGNLAKLIRKLFVENRVYYQSNDLAAFLDSYMLVLDTHR